MFASSRVDKGGNKFKPVFKSRGQVRSSATPSTLEERASAATSGSLFSETLGVSGTENLAEAVEGTSELPNELLEISSASTTVITQSIAPNPIENSVQSNKRVEVPAAYDSANRHPPELARRRDVAKPGSVSVVIPLRKPIASRGVSELPASSSEGSRRASAVPIGDTSSTVAPNVQTRATPIVKARRATSSSDFNFDRRIMPPPSRILAPTASKISTPSNSIDVVPSLPAAISSNEPFPATIASSGFPNDDSTFTLDPALMNQTAYDSMEENSALTQASTPTINMVTQARSIPTARSENSEIDVQARERGDGTQHVRVRRPVQKDSNGSRPEFADDHQSEEEQVQDAETRPRKKRRKAAPDKASRGNRKSANGQTRETEEEVATEKGGKRTRKRKQTALDLVPQDEIELDEDGQPLELNPEVVTMADLCLDMGLGRPSTRTEESVLKSVEWKKNQRLVRQKARERQKAKFSAISQQPGATNEGVSDGENSQHVEGEDHATVPEETGEFSVSAATRRLQNTESSQVDTSQLPADSAADDEDDISGLQESRYAAQVRLDENGEIVLDDLSLTVDRHEAARAEVAGESYEVVEELERDRFVNSLTWSRKLPGSRWNKIETDLFYYYVGMWGTDFEMISHLMPSRTRKEIKNKYNSESRKNPARLELAFSHKIPIDLEELERATGLDLSGPAPEFSDQLDPALQAATTDDHEHIHIPEMDVNGEQSDDQGEDTQTEVDHVIHEDGATSENRASVSPTPDGLGRNVNSDMIGSTMGVTRAGSTSTNATASARGPPVSNLNHKPTKGKKSKSKKSKRRSIALADDEQVIGMVQ